MSTKNNLNDQWMERILRSLEGLEYGSLNITVHDSQITQIERVEKYRYPLEKSNTVKGRNYASPQEK